MTSKRWILVGALLFLLGGAGLSVWARRVDDPLPEGTIAERVLVEKAARRLTLLQGDRPIKTYHIALGREPEGPKQREGDGKTPEGLYFISGRKEDSAFHRALRISYPSEADIARARAAGEPPGGDIMIHGIKNGLGWVGSLHATSDWTEGCIAVTDEEIEELWRAVPDRTPVEIRP